MNRALAAVGVTAVFLLIAFAPAQTRDDEWRMKHTDSPGKVHFTIERKRAGSRWVNSTDVGADRFRGLPADPLSASGPVKFEFTGDAGKLVCEGTFTLRRGIGSYQFVPNPGFASELQSLGYDAPGDDQLFSMMMSDVTLEFARGVKAANVPSTTKELLEMRVHGITLDYLRQMQATGYTGLDARNFIEMKIHGVSSELVRELKQAGYDVPAKKIVEMKIHGVSPEYVRELKTYGLQPSASEVVEMRIHGLKPEYLRGMKDAGYGSLGVREVMNMRIHGVTTEFAQEAHRMGYSFTAKDLTDMRIHGVNTAYLQKLKASGFANLDAQKIVRLKTHGID